MAAVLTLDDVRKAWDAHDPRLIALIEQLCTQPVPTPDTPIRDGALTFDKFLVQLRNWRYRKKTREEQAHYRVETLKALEAPDAEVPLPDKLKVHEVISTLWESNDALARDYLLRIIAHVPLVHGPWKAVKKIFKESEAKNDTEIFGAIAARLDMAHSGSVRGREVSGATIAYLVRRAWRYLRRVGLHLPATYPDVACDFLINYTDSTTWRGTWVFNHILFHDTKKYGRANFRFGWRDKENEPTNLKHRAYGDTWKRSHRPLFSLLERAKSDAVRDYATAALKTDFRQVLRDTEPAWVVRLVAVPSRAIHDFVVWLLQNVPKFEQVGVPPARPARRGAAAVRLAVGRRAEVRRQLRPHPRPRPAGARTRPAGEQRQRGRAQARPRPARREGPAYRGRPRRVGPVARNAARAQVRRGGDHQALRREGADARMVRGADPLGQRAGVHVRHAPAAEGPQPEGLGPGVLRRPAPETRPGDYPSTRRGGLRDRRTREVRPERRLPGPAPLARALPVHQRPRRRVGERQGS